MKTGQKKRILREIAAQNVKRSMYGAVILTVFILAVTIFATGILPYEFSNTVLVNCAFYAIFSAVFACICYHISSREIVGLYSAVSFLYLLYNILYLTYFARVFYMQSSSLAVYCFLVLLGALIVRLNLYEYICVMLLEIGLLFAVTGMGAAETAALEEAKRLTTSQIFGVVIVHMLAFAAQMQLYVSNRIRASVDTKLKKESKMAEVDPLTGLDNRRGMERKVMTLWPTCERGNLCIGVAILDVDFFKKYNDAYGHPQGDLCLKRVAKVISSTARRELDLTGRIGGEEFMVFFYDMEPQEIVSMAEKIRENIQSAAIPHAHGVVDVVTVSIGVAVEKARDNLSFADLYGLADKQLYRAKQAGRNRVCSNIERRKKAVGNR